jgi:hypothetical protein
LARYGVARMATHAKWERGRQYSGESSSSWCLPPRLISRCACIYEFSMTEISCVTCVNGTHPMYLSVFLYPICQAKKCVLKRVYQSTFDGSIFTLLKLFLEMITYSLVTCVLYVCTVCSIVWLLRLCVWILSFCHLLNVISYTTSLSVSDSVCFFFLPIHVTQ